MPSSIRPEFKISASSFTDFIPSPGSVVAALISTTLLFASVILKEEKPLTSASAIVKEADDWFPKELRFKELIVEGIVVTGPSFKNVVATRGFVEDVNTSSIFDGKLTSFVWTVPNSFKSTLPIFLELLLIKFFDAAAKSSGFIKLNLMDADFDLDGEIIKLSPSWGVPRISTW